MKAETHNFSPAEIAAGNPFRPGPAPNPLLPPQVPDHELLRLIGGGSYGQVWLARNATEIYRAVKVVYRRTFERDRPYEREFEGIQKFEPVSRSHPGLVDILHVGRNHNAGYFYYIMELADDASVPGVSATTGGSSPGSCATGGELNPRAAVAGEDTAWYTPKTLGAELQTRGRLSLEECLRLGIGLTEALEHLHEHGLVHRDIKPSNIIFVGGVPKLADVGLVANAGQTLSCVGTEGFIAPEGPGSPQADVYSLGKVLYEISTGKDRHEYPAPPTNLGELPEQEGLLELNEVIFKACAPDPRNRYASAQAMRRDLLAVQSGRSVRRLRLLERRLTWATRAGCVFALLLLLAGAAWLQSSRARRLATERLVRLQVDNALRRMDAGDLSGALPWIAESLEQASGDKRAEEMHRYRFASVWRACPRLTAVCLHQNWIYEASFSPDGRRFVTASADHTAQVWDAASGEPALPPMRLQAEVLHALYTPDGKRIVTIGRDATLQIWDAATGKPLCPPRQQRFHINSVAFSGDGRRVVTGGGALMDWSLYPFTNSATMVTMRLNTHGDPILAPFRTDERWGEAQVWDAETGEPVGGPLAHAAPVEDATLSPDGQWVVTASDDGTAVIWNVAKGEPMIPALRHGAKVRRAVFSPDGARVLTASEDHTAQLWDARTGQRLGPPMRHANGVLHAAFSPDGSRIVTTGRDQNACVWDAANGQLLCLPLRHESDVWYAEFSADGRRLVTAGSESVIRVWDAFSGELLARLCENNGGGFATFSPEGRRVVTVSRDRIARLWDLLPLSPATARLEHEERVNTITFNPQGTRVLTTSSDLTARIWDGAGRAPLTLRLAASSAKRKMDNFRAAAWSPDAQAVVVVQTNAYLYDAAAGTVKFSVADAEAAIRWAAFSPRGERLFTVNHKGTVRVWDARTGRPLRILLQQEQGAVLSAALSPNGRYIAIGTCEWPRPSLAAPTELRVWDTETGQCLSPVMLVAKGIISALAFSPDGRRLLAAAAEPALEPQQAEIWDWRTGKPAAPPLRHLDGVNFALFSPDGQLVATASSDKTAQIWDATTGQPVTKALRHARQVNHIAFSPDGRRVATACEDGTAQVWNVATGEPLSLPFKHDGPVVWTEFSPDGGRMATASEDRTAKIWDLPKADWPLTELQLLAGLLSGIEIDSMGGATPLPPETLQAVWKQLHARHPQDFAVSAQEARDWDEREANASEKAREWSAALFHLERLAAAQPDEPSYNTRRAAVQARLGR